MILVSLVCEFAIRKKTANRLNLNSPGGLIGLWVFFLRSFLLLAALPFLFAEVVFVLYFSLELLELPLHYYGRLTKGSILLLSMLIIGKAYFEWKQLPGRAYILTLLFGFLVVCGLYAIFDVWDF